MKQFYVYIMASYRRTLYIGMTNDLNVRVKQHKFKNNPESFTARYNVDRLVYHELHYDVHEAIAREKQLKGWRRSKKIELIERTNSTWNDLSNDWD